MDHSKWSHVVNIAADLPQRSLVSHLDHFPARQRNPGIRRTILGPLVFECAPHRPTYHSSPFRKKDPPKSPASFRIAAKDLTDPEHPRHQTLFPNRCRANLQHICQSRPDFGLGLRHSQRESFYSYPSRPPPARQQPMRSLYQWAWEKTAQFHPGLK